MKTLFVLVTTILLSFTVNGQSTILKLNKENGSFKNNPLLPYGESFTIEGEISKEISYVEVSVNPSKDTKRTTSYYWNRNDNNNSEYFEIIITNPLYDNTSYDFDFKTFQHISNEEKIELRALLELRINHLLTSEIHLVKNHIEVDNPKKLIDAINQLLTDGIHYYKSRNSIQFSEVSRLVTNEIDKLDNFKLRSFLKRKKRREKLAYSEEIVNQKIEYLTELILAEIDPFINSELVKQDRIYSLRNIKTKKDKFTLPINAGVYAWNTSSNIGNINTNNVGLSGGVGFTIPFKRNIYIRQRSLPNIGYSMGVLFTPVTDPNGNELVTPLVNIPVYAGLGVNFFKVFRFNVAALFLAPKNTTNISKIQVLPTAGLTLELDAWIGVKK